MDLSSVLLAKSLSGGGGGGDSRVVVIDGQIGRSNLITFPLTQKEICDMVKDGKIVVLNCINSASGSEEWTSLYSSYANSTQFAFASVSRPTNNYTLIKSIVLTPTSTSTSASMKNKTIADA